MKKTEKTEKGVNFKSRKYGVNEKSRNYQCMAISTFDSHEREKERKKIQTIQLFDLYDSFLEKKF